MEIQVLEKTDKSIKFNLLGAGHTFCNNLKHELYSDDSVKAAAYRVSHPLIGTPTFIIHLRSGSVNKVLKQAVSRIKKQNSDLLGLFKKL